MPTPFEAPYSKALQQVTNWQTQEGKLMLTNPLTQTRLEYTPTPVLYRWKKTESCSKGNIPSQQDIHQAVEPVLTLLESVSSIEDLIAQYQHCSSLPIATHIQMLYEQQRNSNKYDYHSIPAHWVEDLAYLRRYEQLLGQMDSL
jgi:hypothetical protein